MFVLVVATLSERVARESLAGEDRSADLHSKVALWYRATGTNRGIKRTGPRYLLEAGILFRFRQMDEPSG